MKIAVTGKGGVGKNYDICSISTAVCRRREKSICSRCGSRCKSLDLHWVFSEEELESITPISKMRRLIEERTGADKSNTFL